MKNTIRALAIVAFLVASAIPTLAAERSVAVTFDDLPGPPAGLVGNDVVTLRETTRKLLAAFQDHQVPVVGFVNEGKLVMNGAGEADVEARTGVLQMWLLQVGLDLEKRRAFERFLDGRGYSIAPVTVDDDDYVYAAVYADARRRGDAGMATRVADDYLRYMETVFSFVEDVARKLLGRDVRHVLLLHANSLNADHFGRLAAALVARGYRFIPLATALEDEAYRQPDDYVGDWGISWLHHGRSPPAGSARPLRTRRTGSPRPTKP